MVETVIALLMFVGPEIKEHRIQESMSVCLKHKREATRTIQNDITYKCISSKAKLDKTLQGTDKALNKLKKTAKILKGK